MRYMKYAELKSRPHLEEEELETPIIELDIYSDIEDELPAFQTQMICDWWTLTLYRFSSYIHGALIFGEFSNDVREELTFLRDLAWLIEELEGK